MTYIAKCGNGKMIQLPSGIECSVGCSLKCPDSCPNKESFYCPAPEEGFRVESVTVDDGNVYSGNGLFRYSRTEIDNYWRGQKTLQTFFDFGDSFIVKADGGGPKVSEPNRRVPLVPKKSHTKIETKTRTYTDDMAILRAKPRFRPLAGALRDIFLHWETDVVFAPDKGDAELSDEFVWLLTKVSSKNIYEDEVCDILDNESYNRSQTFFHLFYDVIYKEERPNGFFWCDNAYSYDALLPKFRNKKDFMNLLLSDKSAGLSFYNERKQEILSFLEVDDEEQLFANVTCDSVREGKEIVWLDRKNSNEVKKFGTKEDFISKMQAPSDYAVMKSMVDFLKEYVVTKNGVMARGADEPLQETRFNYVAPGIYTAMQIPENANSKVAYEAAITLISEYVKNFNPDTLRVGPLKFTRDNYGKEIGKYLDEFCLEAMIHSGGVETSKYKGKKNEALLALSLYDKGVFESFAVVDSAVLNEKIKVFKSISSGSIKSMQDYLQRFKKDDVYEHCEAISRDSLVAAWFASAVPKNGGSDVDGAIGRYKRRYNDFKN